MTIKVLGRDIQVVYMPGCDLNKISSTEDCLGMFKDDKIYIAAHLEGAQKRRVVLHEVVHAILHISGLTNLIEDSLEEAIADAMESLDESNILVLLPKL